MDTQLHHLRLARILIFICVLCLGIWAVGFGMYQHLNTPPTGFPVHQDIEIAHGSTLRAVADELARVEVIRSPLLFYLMHAYFFDGRVIQAGLYRFDSPLTSREIAHALISGDHRSPLLSVTLPEGFRVRDLNKYVPAHLHQDSYAELEREEGFLFPDTYHIAPDGSFDEFYMMTKANFTKRLEPYAEEIASSGFSLHEVITLASLIEREAKDTESKYLVSSVLHNRLNIGMALQVDATLDYLLDKTSAELTTDDLNNESLYNTYVHPGLPPGPIANPGLASIEAALRPYDTEYLYYLTGSDGTFHYAKTFEEHKQNKFRYLK